MTANLADQVEVAIRLAGFSEWDRDSATEGLCGTFALALKAEFPQVDLDLICLADGQGKALIAADGQPYWKHVVARVGDRLFDIDGAVLLDDLILNYCWDNPRGKGGTALPVNAAELKTLLNGDGKSFCAHYMDKWQADLRPGAQADFACAEIAPRLSA